MEQNSLFEEEENFALIKHHKELIEDFGIMMETIEDPFKNQHTHTFINGDINE